MEVVGDQVIDMRATYSYIPPYSASGMAAFDKARKHFAETAKQIGFQSTRTPAANINLKAVQSFVFPLLLVFVSSWYYLRNYGQTEEPSRGGIITSLVSKSSGFNSKHSSLQPDKPATPTDIASKPTNDVQIVQPPPVQPTQQQKDDEYVRSILDTTYLRVSSMMVESDQIKSINIVSINEQTKLIRYINMDHLRMYGYLVVNTDSGVEIVKGAYRKSIPKGFMPSVAVLSPDAPD